jgi:hypothetical protein
MAFVVALTFLAAVGGLVWLHRSGQAQERAAALERSVYARKLGWRYDDMRLPGSDYRFTGAGNGIAWTMHYDPDRTGGSNDSSPRPKAHWSSANVRTPGLSLVILSESRYRLESGVAGRLVMGLVTGAVQAMLGTPERTADKPAFYESAIPLTPAGAPRAFPFALVVAPDMPRAWADAELLRLLAAWPGERPVSPDALEATLGPAGLAIVVREMPPTMAHWQHLARLGEHLAARLAAARS